MCLINNQSSLLTELEQDLGLLQPVVFQGA